MPMTVTPAPSSWLRLSRKSHACVVQPGSHRGWVEVHDDPTSSKLLQGDEAAIGVRQGEVGRRIARLQLDGGVTCATLPGRIHRGAATSPPASARERGLVHDVAKSLGQPKGRTSMGGETA